LHEIAASECAHARCAGKQRVLCAGHAAPSIFHFSDVGLQSAAISGISSFRARRFQCATASEARCAEVPADSPKPPQWQQEAQQRQKAAVGAEKRLQAYFAQRA